MLPLPSITLCLDMEQFVLVLASVNIKSLNTQSSAEQELSNYQLSQNHMYQLFSLKKIIKKLNIKEDPLVDKILSFPRIKLSNSQTWFWMVEELDFFCQILLNNSVVQTHTFLTFI